MSVQTFKREKPIPWENLQKMPYLHALPMIFAELSIHGNLRGPPKATFPPRNKALLRDY